MIYVSKKKAKIRNRYNQVPHLTSADAEGGTGGPDPPGKSQVI